MAANTIKAAAPMKVPHPSNSADFVLGSRPAVLRAPALQRIKPEAAPSRDYGKTPPLGGTTRTTGET